MAERKRKNKPTTAQQVTTGTTMRIQPPQSSRRPAARTKARAARKVVEEVNPVGGFTEFLREYTVVTLAIGFVIATQVQGLVKQMLADFINPLSQLLFATELTQRTFTLHFHTHYANFAWGDLVYGLIEFLIVLIIIYAIIKLFRLEKLNKPKK